MTLRKFHELFSDPTKRIQLQRVLSRPGLKKLIVSLLEINRRGPRHVVEVITLPIPRQRWTHRWSVSRVIEVVRTGKVLRLCKCCCRVTEIGCVVVEEIAARLSCGAASKGDTHCGHRHHGGSLHSQ